MYTRTDALFGVFYSKLQQAVFFVRTSAFRSGSNTTNGNQERTKCTVTEGEGALPGRQVKEWSDKKYQCTIQPGMRCKVPSKMQGVHWTI